jgi:hypothetical protein
MSDLRRAVLTILWYAFLAVVSVNVIYTLGDGKRLTPGKTVQLEGLQYRAQSIVQQVLGISRAPSPNTPSGSEENEEKRPPIPKTEPSPDAMPPRERFPDRVPRRVSLPTLRERPDAYRRLFSWAAQTYGVELALIRAIAHAESAGDPTAISHDGAMGIMQLMPNTARRYREVSTEQLHLPSLNIDIGTAHLKWLKRKVKTHFPSARTSDRVRVQLIAASYNAGWERVLQHWGVPPYRETRIYVRRVRRFYRRFSAPDSA